MSGNVDGLGGGGVREQNEYLGRNPVTLCMLWIHRCTNSFYYIYKCTNNNFWREMCSKQQGVQVNAV